VSASSAGEQAVNQPLTEEQQLIHRQALRDVMPKTPFMGWLGIVFERYEPDDVVTRLPLAHAVQTYRIV
jgi:acyl-coenzyme A thioesterase PaaI-like protein